MWTNKQKATIHIYKAAAGLEDAEYRELLREATGHDSAAAKGLSNGDFEMAMAAMEARLAWGVEQGLVDMPDSRKIRDLDYWRRRKPKEVGKVTRRQLQFIGHLLQQLRPYWTHIEDQNAYLIKIVAKATGKGRPILDLTVSDAGKLIEALKDRLEYARPQ